MRNIRVLTAAAALAMLGGSSLGAITFSNFQVSGSLVGGSLPNAIITTGLDDVDFSFIFPAATVGDPVHPRRAGNIIITFDVDSDTPITTDVLSILGAVSGSGFIIFNEVVEDRRPGFEGIIASTSIIINANNPPPVGQNIDFATPTTSFKVKKTIFMSAADTPGDDLAQIGLIEQKMVPTPGAMALAGLAGVLAFRRRR
ncbi:MAG: hypothetical protein HBSAPP03_22600 [Phycisphaerae bacterium]|nr:MAG: hypothetical protein HBSAPP03_22600 [Phycisphaerae bacterium]